MKSITLSHWELSYLDLISEIQHYGEQVTAERTGVGTKRLVGRTLQIPLNQGFPILTSRKVSWRIAFWETMMFLQGITNTQYLSDKGISIWEPNTSREFLDRVGLNELPEREMGKGYGYQWRNFGGVDQLVAVLDALKNNPQDRRILISAWNPGELNQMALPPCHLLHQYTIRKGHRVQHNGVSEKISYLDSLFYMRSTDIIYGLPYNLMSYSFLLHAFSNLLSNQLGYEILPGTLTYVGFDCHIYNNQSELATALVDRKISLIGCNNPQLQILKPLHTLDDLLGLDIRDTKIHNYVPFPDFENKPAMAV